MSWRGWRMPPKWYVNNSGSCHAATGSFRGISIDNADADSDPYVRRIYHNTFDLPDARVVVSAEGAPVDIRNNIGPSLTSNIATQRLFLVNNAARDTVWRRQALRSMQA
jgi:hypothetical protein